VVCAFGMTVPRQPNTPASYQQFIAKQMSYQGELAKLSGNKEKP
jgi:hypothetical protein